MKIHRIAFLTILISIGFQNAFAGSECQRKGSVKWVQFESISNSTFLIKTNNDDGSKSVMIYKSMPDESEVCEELRGPYAKNSDEYAKLNDLEKEIRESSTAESNKPWLYFLKKDLPNEESLKSKIMAN